MEEVDRNKASSSSAMVSVPTSGGGKKSKPVATSYKAMNTIFREPICKLLSEIKSQPFFKWPQPMKGDPSTLDQNKFCAYYKQNGHRTETARPSKLTSKSSSRTGT